MGAFENNIGYVAVLFFIAVALFLLDVDWDSIFDLGGSDLFIFFIVAIGILVLVWQYFFKGKPKDAEFVQGKSESEESPPKDGAGSEDDNGDENKGENKESSKSDYAGGPSMASLILLAAAGRLLLSVIPSVEPVIPVAVYAGFALGPEAGVLVGVLGYVLSNIFLWGGIFNPWTVAQAVGGAIPGLVAGLMRQNFSSEKYIMAVAAGTVVFEIIMNVSYNWEFNIGYFMSSMPYSLTHIVSNVAIAVLLAPFLKARMVEQGFAKEESE